MTALLALYMVKQLLLPGHAEHVLGLDRACVTCSSSAGRCADQAFASLIYGWYGELVYFTPIASAAGSPTAGSARRATVALGATVDELPGHLAMTFDATVPAGASACWCSGQAALKGNISAQVGTLYPQDAESLPGARLHHLLDRHQHRRGAWATGDRRGRRS